MSLRKTVFPVPSTRTLSIVCAIMLQALDAMAEIQERHEAVKDLEHSLTDLHQIFLDMSVLVEAQGEQLDNIEQQVSLQQIYASTGTCT